MIGRLLLIGAFLLIGRVGRAAGSGPALPADTASAHWEARLRTHPQPDTTRVVWLTRWASALEAHDVRSARPVRLAALALARQLAYRDLVAETLLDLAYYHMLLAQYDSATVCLRESRQQFQDQHDLGGEVRCLGSLGQIADLRGQYVASLKLTFQALALATTSDTRRFNTSLKIQLGTTYAQVGAYADARNYLFDALRVARHQDYPDRENLALSALGEICRQQQQWGAARAYFTQSMAVSQRLGNTPAVLAAQLSLALVSEAEEDGTEAARLGQQVLVRLQAAHLVLLVPQAQALLARMALRAGQQAQAIAYGEQSLAASYRIHSPARIRDASGTLAQAYAESCDFAQAFRALRRFNAAKDSLTGDVTRRRAALLEFNHQQAEQQAEIRLLTQQNHLQAQEQELGRLHQQRTRLLSGAVGLLGLLLAGRAFQQYRRRQAGRDTALRARLAADLHDDVGSLLTQIGLQSDLLRDAPASAAQTLARLNCLGDTSRRAARQMADVVWGLHASSALLPEVLAHMRDHAHEVFSYAGLTVDFAVTANVPALYPSVAVCQNLYLIYKEALHNVVKHAHGATLVTVRLSYKAGQLGLSVRDNAPGPASVAARPGGHGLHNMRQRAAAVGGTLHLVADATGFAVVAGLPA